MRQLKPPAGRPPSSNRHVAQIVGPAVGGADAPARRGRRASASPARASSPRAVIGMALGFAYFVVDNAALAMGNFGGYPPLLAAWAPFVLFVLMGETVLIRTEE